MRSRPPRPGLAKLLAPRRSLWCGAIGSGLLLGLATAQVGFGWLAFCALVPLLAALDAGPRPGAAALAGWLSGSIYFAWALLWVPLGYNGALFGLALLYILGLGLGLGAFAASLAWLRARDRRLFLAAAPVLWILFEYLRSLGSLGYPWHHLGYSLTAYPWLIQLAAVGGLFSLSLWIAAVNSALVGLRGIQPARVALTVAILSAPLALGLRAWAPAASDETLRVAAVQPAVREPGQLDVTLFRANLSVLVDLTDRALATPADLVVWPESAFGRRIGASMDPLLGGIAHHYGTPLLSGAWRVRSGSDPVLWNSAVLAHGDGRVVLGGDKVHPVPYYEGTPSTWLEQLLARVIPWPGRFRPGERPGLVEIQGKGEATTLGLLICLDASYPELARNLRLRGARLLVEISNESITGEWSARHHAHVSRLRAVETGTPLVRVANMGPTEWIDARGRVVARLDPGEPASTSAAVSLASGSTPYLLLGDAPAFVVGVLPIAPFVRRRRRPATRAEASSPPQPQEEDCP